MKEISKKIYKVDPAAPSITTVRPGESFLVNVQNAFGKTFKNVSEFEAFLSPENEQEKNSLNHPLTGPIEIDTKNKDCSLAITIEDVKITNAFQCVSKSTGFLKDRFTDRACEIFDVKDGNLLKMKDGDLVIRTHPKIGFISTIDNQERSAGRSSENGGNLDLNFLDKGSTIYLPVNAKKARLLIGDLHACQGNGEAAGIAIEADGQIQLRAEVVDKIPFPVIDDKHRLIIVGWGETLEKAAEKVTENSIEFLKRIFPFCHWGDIDVYKFISAEGNVVLGNASGKVKTCGMVFHKRRISNKYDFPIL